MDETALDPEGATLPPQEETVRRFYRKLWGHADESPMPAILQRTLRSAARRAPLWSATSNSLTLSTG
jgi:hypothetical protein